MRRKWSFYVLRLAEKSAINQKRLTLLALGIRAHLSTSIECATKTISVSSSVEIVQISSWRILQQGEWVKGRAFCI
jgi:hypothetical protein